MIKDVISRYLLEASNCYVARKAHVLFRSAYSTCFKRGDQAKTGTHLSPARDALAQLRLPRQVDYNKLRIFSPNLFFAGQ